jgi:hypothetical protein
MHRGGYSFKKFDIGVGFKGSGLVCPTSFEMNQRQTYNLGSIFHVGWMREVHLYTIIASLSVENMTPDEIEAIYHSSSLV